MRNLQCLCLRTDQTTRRTCTWSKKSKSSTNMKIMCNFPELTNLLEGKTSLLRGTRLLITIHPKNEVWRNLLVTGKTHTRSTYWITANRMRDTKRTTFKTGKLLTVISEVMLRANTNTVNLVGGDDSFLIKFSYFSFRN